MDLNEPLGVRPPTTDRRRSGSGAIVIAAISVAVCALAGLGVFFATADPHGGEPYAIAAIPPVGRPRASTNVPTDLTSTGSVSAAPGDAARPQGPPQTALVVNAGTMEAGVKVYRGTGDAAGAQASTRSGPLIIDVTKTLDDPLSRRSPPANAERTAPPLMTSTPAAGSPRVAIFVEGMGLSETATRTALETMPPAVDLAFVPYGASLESSVAKAKASGHEILLQLPMATAQGGAPGPHALRADESPRDLADDLAWLTSRFQGYAGMTNLLGASVTASRPVMTALLKAVASRGLFYVDDGTSKRSLATSLGSEAGASVVQADVVIDATGDPNVVRANLERLAELAKRNGHAIGMASGLPDHLAAIAHFAGDLGGRGLTLVPVSALAGHDTGHDANLATTR